MVYDVPLSRRRLCCYCATQLDSRGAGVHKLMKGWVAAHERKRGSSSNSLTFGKDLDTYICADCYDKLRQGIPVGQLSLLAMDDE